MDAEELKKVLDWLKTEIEAAEGRWTFIQNDIEKNEQNRAALAWKQAEIENKIRNYQYLEAVLEGKL